MGRRALGWIHFRGCPERSVVRGAGIVGCAVGMSWLDAGLGKIVDD